MHLKSFLSAAKSSCRSAIGSPFTANTDAENGTPAADCGYTPQPCGVGVETIQIENLYMYDYLFCTKIALRLEIISRRFFCGNFSSTY